MSHNKLGIGKTYHQYYISNGSLVEYLHMTNYNNSGNNED